MAIGLWSLANGQAPTANSRFRADVTNELVDWFNKVDATYRGDLRELNELTFARFDAKLEQRLAELDAKWLVRSAQLDAKIEQRAVQLDAKIDALGDTLRKALAQSLGELKSSLLKWMFGFWVATALTLIGLFSGLIPTR